MNRKTEFFLGRKAAFNSLKNLGISSPPPILIGKDREPIWPKGINGSISHSGKYAVSISSLRKDIYLGIDIQKIREIKSIKRLTKKIATDREILLLENFSSIYQNSLNPFLQTILFSAKEAIYKAFFVATKEKLKFLDISIEFDKSVITLSKNELEAFLTRDINKEYKKGKSFFIKTFHLEGDYILNVFIL